MRQVQPFAFGRPSPVAVVGPVAHEKPAVPSRLIKIAFKQVFHAIFHDDKHIPQSTRSQEFYLF